MESVELDGRLQTYRFRPYRYDPPGWFRKRRKPAASVTLYPADRIPALILLDFHSRLFTAEADQRTVEQIEPFLALSADADMRDLSGCTFSPTV